MNLSKKNSKYRLAMWLRIGMVLSVTVTYVVISFASRGVTKSEKADRIFSDSYRRGGRKLQTLVADYNCTPSAVNEFPSDGLTREQRIQGWAAIHALFACYLFILMGVVCESYFVPAVKSICTNLRMKEDVTGATFMAVAGSSSELFINCVGTFITQGDLGVGTVVGSAVFNVLGVPACCGLFANTALQLEWWPVTRDCVMYGIAVSMLIKILGDEKVYMAEAAALVAAYFLYIVVMYFNENITNAITRLRRSCRRSRKIRYQEILSETHPLLIRCEKNGCANFKIANGEITLKDCEELEESMNIWKWPIRESNPRKFFWVISWPISLMLYLTIPDCKKYPRLTSVTFSMCIVWIGISSYIVAWFITVIGDTLDIPDSVMGITFLAAGTSVPEAVSSVIVANQGHGAMGVSSAIGSNTFDILLCLGIPWLLKTSINPKDPESHSIVIKSKGLAYNAVCLLATLIIFYLTLCRNKFRCQIRTVQRMRNSREFQARQFLHHFVAAMPGVVMIRAEDVCGTAEPLDWKIGVFYLALYTGFLCIASLIELNVFFPVNLPTCDR